MTVAFRNIGATASDPVEQWGVEGLLTALERGGAREWALMARTVRRAPRGPVAVELSEALAIADAPGAVALLSSVLADAQDPDRAATVRRLRRAWRASGMTQAELAQAAGTSRPRLTSYLSGAQQPTSDVAERIIRVATTRRSLPR